VGVGEELLDEQIFSVQGLPRPSCPTNKRLVSYLLSHPGAIGYVT